MKKTIVTISALLMTVIFATAQKNGGFAKGDNLLNVGVGVNSYYSNGIPVGASYEKGVTDEISVGLNVDYLSAKYGYYYDNYKFTALYIGVRGAYHFNEVLKINDDKVDVYGGATIGFRSFKWGDGFDKTFDTYGSGVYFGAFIGGKYYFSSNIGGFLELGAIGSTNARVGLAFKF